MSIFSFSAELVLAPEGLLRNACVNVDAAGTVLGVGAATSPHLPGLLLPGWVNAHCHLELSHLAGRISGGEGMAHFARQLVPLRDAFSPEEQTRACAEAMHGLWVSGTAAVGDIANGPVSLAPKQALPQLSTFSFAEAFSLDPTRALAQAEAAAALARQFGPHAAPTPHAPYSCSPQLLEALYRQQPSRLSVHLLESREEIEYVQSGTGPLAQIFHAEWGLPRLDSPQHDPLEHIFAALPQGTPTLLIHLTELNAAHRARLEQLRALGHVLYEVLCPRSNHYLHRRLPDFTLFDARSPWLCLGTDSLASCPTLDLLDELKALTAAWPAAHPEGLLFAATRNGAQALGFSQLGTFTPGARPRVLHLHPVTPEGRVRPDTRCQVLA